MNINASNHSLDNVFIQQKTEKKRPSFSSVFEKLNKRVEKMNRKTPLNNVLTNEQLFRYYIKETEPLLKKSNDDFGDGNISLGDMMRNSQQSYMGDGDGGGDNPPEEPPTDTQAGIPSIYNNIMEKTNGNIVSKNRFQALENTDEEDEEAGSAMFQMTTKNGLKTFFPGSGIVEESLNTLIEDEESFDPSFAVSPVDGTVIINTPIIQNSSLYQTDISPLNFNVKDYELDETMSGQTTPGQSVMRNTNRGLSLLGLNSNVYVGSPAARGPPTKRTLNKNRTLDLSEFF